MNNNILKTCILILPCYVYMFIILLYKYHIIPITKVLSIMYAFIVLFSYLHVSNTLYERTRLSFKPSVPTHIRPPTKDNCLSRNTIFHSMIHTVMVSLNMICGRLLLSFSRFVTSKDTTFYYSVHRHVVLNSVFLVFLS